MIKKLGVLLKRYKEILVITYLVKILLFLIVLLWNNNHRDAEYLYWVQWDSPHYIDIAKTGYVTTGTEALWIVFYPLYPLLIRLFSTIFQNFELTAVLIPIFFSFATSIALFELVLLDFPKKIAIKAVWFLSIFPTAYFLQSAYTESLFLFLTITSIYFFRTKKIILSAIFAALSSATRVNGIFLAPLFIVEAIKMRKVQPWYKSCLPILFTPLGLIIYLSINFHLYHDFFYFTKPLESNWYKKFAPPWEGLINMYQSFPQTTDYLYPAYLLEATSLLIALCTSIFILIKVKKSYALYIWLNLFLFISTSFVVSTPRYVLSLFPIFIAFAMIKNKFLFSFLSLLFMIGLVFFTLRFTNGEWAF